MVVDGGARYLYGADGNLFEIDQYGLDGHQTVAAADDPSDGTMDIGSCTGSLVMNHGCVPY